MHKIFLSVASIIVTHFLQKAYRKITEKATSESMEKAEYNARPMRNDQRDALSIIEQANLDLMESLAR